MTATDFPDVHVPDLDELRAQLGDDVPLAKRIEYVRSLLAPVEAVRRGVVNYQRRVDELERGREGMATELTALRKKLADFRPGERDALEARYEMIGKLSAARGKVPHLRREINERFDELERVLKR